MELCSIYLRYFAGEKSLRLNQNSRKVDPLRLAIVSLLVLRLLMLYTELEIQEVTWGAPTN